MPRTPLGPIDPNRISRRGPELTPYKRGQVIALLKEGYGPTEVASKLDLPRTTVTSTRDADAYRKEGKSRPRPGAPKKATPRIERSLLRHIRLDPKIQYDTLRQLACVDFSNSTIRRILKKYGIAHWLAKKRPKLTSEAASKRLAFALQHRAWTLEQWKKVIWSDECSVERGSGKKREWAFGYPSQKWDADKIQTYEKGKDISIMVWAAFWGAGISDLYVLERDFESKKMGYSAKFYLQILDDNLKGIYEPGLIFMQDNAPIHTAKKVKEWFIEWGVKVMEWPPYSPDLNPIEHLWFHLKNQLLKDYPDLLKMGKSEGKVRSEMGRALRASWAKLPVGLKDELLASMSSRMEAVIEAEGWYTKY